MHHNCIFFSYNTFKVKYFCKCKYITIYYIVYFTDVALERETEGDLILADMGEGVPFRAGTFDGAISVSAIQWLFNADKKTHNPVKRLYTFFSSLYASLVSIFLMTVLCYCFKNFLGHKPLQFGPLLNLACFHQLNSNSLSSQDQQEQFSNFILKMKAKWIY